MGLGLESMYISLLVEIATAKLPLLEIPDDSPENDISARLTVREAVNSLKQPYRTVVVLFYYENLSVSKIAQITSTNMPAVKKQLSRARKMLREILKEDFNG